jgi:putative ABC transport system permease protein
MLPVFHRLIVRPLRHEPLRTALTVFAIALGVGVVLAIDLAGDAAAGSFRASMETLAGDADFEVTAAGGVDEALIAKLARAPEPIRVKPRLEGYATIVATNEAVPLIGVDFVADALENAASLGDDEPFRQEETLWASEGLGLKPGDTVRLLVEDTEADYRIGGVFRERGRALAADILLAQRLLRRQGKLDRILVWTPPAATPEAWQAKLAAFLPPAVSVAPYGSRTRENRRMLEAFRWNLRVLSYIALVVGAFLIYNTISVSVVRRRADIGILRAIGATRRWILGAFLGEAALFGLAGAVLGVALGRVLAEGAVRLVGATVESLYVSSQPGDIRLTPGAVFFALTTGVVVSIFSALGPAREAASVRPIEAMARGRVDWVARTRAGRGVLLAAALGALAVLAARLPPVGGKPIGGYAAAMLLIGAAALAIPMLVGWANRALSPLLKRFPGVESMLAMRSLAASMHRTSVLVAALTTATAMMISVGIMVGSFRETVLVWMNGQLKADLYLRPAGPAAADRFPTLDASLADRLAALPEVRLIDRFRAYPISYRGLPATLGGGETAAVAQDERLRFAAGDRDLAMARLPTCDCVIVSEPFANKHNVRVGDRLQLAFGEFEVLGVYFDYANERGYVIMDRATLLKYLPDPAPSNLAIWLRPGVEIEAGKRAVEAAARGSRVVVFANQSLREEAIRIFDRTFAITYALEAVAILVAVMGVAGALLALVIDRRREFGLLRFLGASTGQVKRIIFSEAGLLGLLSAAAGSALGVLLSLVLVFVINKQSFGWTIQFHWPVGVLLAALAVVYAATLLAALYPARIAAQLNPIEVVHEE